MFLVVPAAYGGEGFGNHYPGGNEDFTVGRLPKPGTSIFINYLVDYHVTKLMGNNGGAATLTNPRLVAPRGPFTAGRAGFKLDSIVDTMRYIRVTNVKVAGGDLFYHVVVPTGYKHVALSDITEANVLGPNSHAGLGDIETGVGIAWHCGNFHNLFAFDWVMPTGEYSGDYAGRATSNRNFKPDPGNLGRNYWSFNPIWAFTYLGDKDSPIPGLELSAKLIYFVNTVNSETGYVSGQEFDVDYLAGYHINKDWAIGANGFFLYQTTKDRQFGRTAVNPLTGRADGVLGRNFSVGPAISYTLPKGCVTFKYQRDVWDQNRPEGDKYWRKLVFLF
jgi:hypothetical protein